MLTTGILHLIFLGLLAVFPVVILIQVRAERKITSGRFRWARKPRVELRWILGPDTLDTIRLPAGNYLIGRSPESHVAVNHAAVSNRHAVLMVRRKHTSVMDTDSLNGVRIESLPLKPWTRVRIPDRQTVFLSRDAAFEHRRLS
ncbi:FHA domain-containing protein [bacterium]|nr:FHA domain-containing protein [bacterium]